MADVTVHMDQAAIDAMARDPDGPVGRIIEAAAEWVADAQRTLAPVSDVGSLFAPSGFLKEHIGPAESLHHDDDGTLLGLAGTRTNRGGGAYPYPLAFISSASGRTANRGGKSSRRADNRFIVEALAALESFTWYEP